MGDRIVVMNFGEVRQIGTPAEVYDDPADTFVATFLGSPPMNLVEQGRRDRRLPSRSTSSRSPSSPGARPSRSTSACARPRGPVRPAGLPGQPRGVPGRGADRLRNARGRAASEGKKVVSRMSVDATSPGTSRAAVHAFAVTERHLKFFDRATQQAHGDEARPRSRGGERARDLDRALRARAGSSAIAMFAPAVLFIVLLIGVPFGLAVLYAFSDARIGSTSFHFVGLENFRSILQSPSFRKALRNSIVFTLCAQVIVIVCSNILVDRPREALPRPRVRAVPDPAAVGGAGLARHDRLEVDPRLHLQRDHVGARRAALLQAVQRPDVARASRTSPWRRSSSSTAGG